MKCIISIAFVLLILSCNNSVSEPKPFNDGNNTITEADNVLIGDIISVVFSSYEDIDFFRLDLVDDICLHFYTKNMGEALVPQIEILDHEGTSLSIARPNNDGDDINFYYFASVGTYYLKVQRWVYTLGDSTFDIYLDKYTEDIYENNNEISKSCDIVFNTSHHATILPVGDFDYYSFTLDSAQIVQIQIDSISQNLNLAVKLFNSDNIEISKIENTVDNQIYLYSLSPGRYNFAIFDSSNIKYSTKPYYFKLYKMKFDSNEPNNTIETSNIISMNSSIRGNILPGNDIDIFKINIVDSVNLSITIDSIPMVLSLQAILSNSVGNNIVIEDNFTSPNFIEINKAVLPGEYFLSLSEKSKYSFSDELYELNIKIY